GGGHLEPLGAGQAGEHGRPFGLDCGDDQTPWHSVILAHVGGLIRCGRWAHPLRPASPAWGRMSAMATRSVTGAAPRAKLDQACAAAAELAREAITDEAITDDAVGGHVGVAAEGDRLVTHYFECLLDGYRGWRWAVTLARAPRSRHITVCECVLLPGDDALLAPAWVPWHERLQPGDLGIGDLLPTRIDDERLVPGYLLSDDPAVEEVAWELGLGRARVMSREGRAGRAQRWGEGAGRDTRALVRRRARPARADRRRGTEDGPLRPVRVLPTAGRAAAPGLRCLRPCLCTRRPAGGPRPPPLR